MEQKTVSYDDLQLAHHLINQLFRTLGPMNPWLYQAQGTIPLSLGAHTGLWQSPYGQVQSVLGVWPGSPRTIPFGRGFIPIY